MRGCKNRIFHCHQCISDLPFGPAIDILHLDTAHDLLCHTAIILLSAEAVTFEMEHKIIFAAGGRHRTFGQRLQLLKSYRKGYLQPEATIFVAENSICSRRSPQFIVAKGHNI